MRKTKTSSYRRSQPEARGSMRVDGSWNESMTHESRVEQYVRTMVRSRLASKMPPAELAGFLLGSPHAQAFPSAPEWKVWTRWEQWAHAATLTTAEEAIKRCGVEGFGHWEGGLFVTGRDERQHIEMPASEIAVLVDGLMDGIKNPAALKPWEVEP